MYYNGSSFIYNRPTASKVEKTEYAEMVHVKALATRVAVLEDRESKIVNQVATDKAILEDAIDQIRYNYQAINDLRYEIDKLKNALSVAKKRRRVTICAGDQKVEIIRVNN